MAEPPSYPLESKTEEIQPDRWIPYLAEFTREYRGAHAQLHVFGPDVGYQLETGDQPFDGIAADIKAGENAVWIMFGDTPEHHHSHGIQNVLAIRLRLEPPEEGGAAMEIEARDGLRTVLMLTSPESYALPPGRAA